MLPITPHKRTLACVWTNPPTRSLHIDGLEGEARLPAPLLQLHVLDLLKWDGLLAHGNMATAVVLGRVEYDTVVVHLEGREGQLRTASGQLVIRPQGSGAAHTAGAVATVLFGRV